MQIAIVGLAGSGKTTVFNTLTRGNVQTGGFGGMELHVGVVKVPDPRLDRLAEIFHPRKIVHADVTYVDLPAPPASSEGRIGTEELPAEHLARLRDADALLHVVRGWDDPALPHPAGSVDPWRDLEQLDLEFVLADLAVVDRRLERLRGAGRHGSPAEREANEREAVLLDQRRARLVDGHPIRDEALDPDDEKRLRGFRFLTQKPVLVLLNVGEADLPREALPHVVQRGGQLGQFSRPWRSGANREIAGGNRSRGLRDLPQRGIPPPAQQQRQGGRRQDRRQSTGVARNGHVQGPGGAGRRHETRRRVQEL